MSRILWLWSVAGLCCVPLLRSSANPALQPGQIAASCAACHRTDGRDSGIPPVAGMDENRILQRMAAYRLKTDGDQIMHVVAVALTPEETVVVAHYLAVQHVAALQR